MRKDNLIAGLPIPARIRQLFENPPLLASESRQEYAHLFRETVDAIRPVGAIEWFWVQDIALYRWEIRRLRAFKRDIIEHQRSVRADKLAMDAFVQKQKAENPNFHAYSEYFIRQGSIDPELKPQLTPKLDTELDTAVAFSESIDRVDKVERQIASLEHRLRITLREIELRREIIARRSREAPDNLIEGADLKPLVPAE